MPQSQLSDRITAQQAGLRLRRLQTICESNGLDALLFIAGMDAKYHAGTQMALSYVFCGHSGRDIIDAGRLPTCLEDVVLVVARDSISLFCHPQAYPQLVKLVVPFFGEANIICPSEEEADDPDVYEELKIAAFVQMMRKYERVGVPLSVEMKDGHHVACDPREVDWWPLIQAYGLEGVGRPGFFTQHYTVETIQKAAQQRYCQLDALALEQLLLHNVPNMRKHWLEVAVSITETLPTNLTEQLVAQPLLNYFMHGTIRNAVEVRQVATMPPKVLFGSNTNDDTRTAGATRLADVAAKDGQPCVHLTVSGADPKSPIRVARTFFLSRGALVKDVFADSEGVGSIANGHGAARHDWQHLTHLYAALVDAAHKAMEHFATEDGATSASARAAATAELLQRCAACGVLLTEEDLRQNLQFALWSADHTNRVSGQARQYSRKLKVLSMTLANITSTAPGRQGALLGALTYADTFIEVQGGFGEAPQLLVLTSNIPTSKFFACDMSEARAAAAAHRNLATWLSHSGQAAAAALPPSVQRPGSAAAHLHAAAVAGVPSPLGALLSTGGGEEAILLTSAPLLPAAPGFARLFAHGLVFSSRTTNLLSLDLRRDVSAVAIQHLQSPASGLPAIGDALVIYGRSSCCTLAPACLMTTERCLVLPLLSLSAMNRRQLLVKVLPVWQQTCREAGIPWEKDTQAACPLPADLYERQYFALQQATKRWPLHVTDEAVEQALARLDRLELAATCPPQPDIESILLRQPPSASTSPLGSSSSAAAAASSAARPQPPCLAETTATISLDPSRTSPGSISVVLVVGVPGANQQFVASALAKTVGGTASVVVHHPVRGATLDQQQLEQDLDQAVEALQDTPSASPTVILATATYTGVASQLRALSVARQFRDGACVLLAVVASVSTACVYEDEACCQWLPGVLEQVSPGLVDLVVLSGSKHASRVQALLYLRNPCVPIVRAAWGAIVQATARLLASQPDRLTRLREDPRLQQQRACSSLTAAAAPRGMLCGSLQAVWMAFSGSIDLALLKSSLGQLGGSSVLADDGAGRRHVPLEVCGPEETPVHALHFVGLLRLQHGAAVQEVRASRGTDVAVKQFEGGPAPAHVLRPPEGQEPGGEVLVIGAGVTAAKISVMLRACLVAVPDDPLAQGASTLSSEELQQLQEQHRLDPLPDGHYYTGSSYVGPFGDTSATHPRMDQFVAQRLAQVDQQRHAEAEQRAARQAALVPFQVLDVSEVCLGQ